MGYDDPAKEFERGLPGIRVIATMAGFRGRPTTRRPNEKTKLGNQDRGFTMEKEWIDRSQSIRERLVELQDSL